MSKTTDRPIVSVCMISYNHAAFITDAIESILTQSIARQIEIVIGDDCSTDETPAIIRNIAQSHPDINWQLNLRDKNVGVAVNFGETLLSCTGKYVAILEGDDFWTDERKLEKQIELLEKSPQSSTCFTLCKEVGEDDGSEKIVGNSRPNHFNLSYILKHGWFMRTPTLMFRRDVISELPSWFYSAYSTDYILHVLFASGGGVIKLDEVTAVYRRHMGGVSIANVDKQMDRFIQKMDLLSTIDDYFIHQFSHEIKFQKRSYYRALISYAWRYKRWHSGIITHFSIDRKIAVLKMIWQKTWK